MLGRAFVENLVASALLALRGGCLTRVPVMALGELNPILHKNPMQPVRPVADESFQHVVVDAESFPSFWHGALVGLGSGPI